MSFADDQKKFDDAYWASLPLELQALRNAPTDQVEAQAEALAQRGFTIDVPIMVFQWDPYVVMTLRQNAGLTWAPSALQPNIGYYTQGVNNPPYQPYDPTKPPAGSIKVSNDIKDYPPVVKPAPVPAPSTDVVGSLVFGNLYGPGPGAMKDSLTPNVTDGQHVSQDGSDFTARVVRTLFGISVSFTKN